MYDRLFKHHLQGLCFLIKIEMWRFIEIRNIFSSSKEQIVLTVFSSLSADTIRKTDRLNFSNWDGFLFAELITSYLVFCVAKCTRFEQNSVIVCFSITHTIMSWRQCKTLSTQGMTEERSQLQNIYCEGVLKDVTFCFRLLSWLIASLKDSHFFKLYSYLLFIHNTNWL